ncbi:farnesol dehydrogenase-like, partial [Gigantopelta aegis]|uniref:farnesol dehydrogenase-like n=1 Tax=Gigantopelta aegis TaxID=1735272 RepID=UPI001B889BCD
MERWIGRVALVTGASSGIGAAITVTLAQKGMIVIGVARNKRQSRERVDDGHIIILNSVAGHKVIQAASIHFYCA